MNRNLTLFIILLLFGCKSEPITQFKSLPASYTGITFNNQVEDNDSLSVLNYEYIYNGGGVAIGDLNGDDLQDLVFTGNMVDNAVYLNKGNMKFEDISEKSGILSEKRWSTGVALVDINLDGKLDIYITASGHNGIENKTNQLFINQGTDENGVPTFKEQAAAYNIADKSNSTNAVFFDYDNDDDLDLFIIVNRMRDDQNPSQYRPKVVDGSSRTVDRLYKNEWSDSLGHPIFTEVGKEAGILIEGFSLGVNICDINQDGWKDIYVTNDYLTNDLLYINNQNGTFTNKADAYFKHTSFSAMGNDVIDLNNDGNSEIIALDMLPEDNYRRKTMMPPNKYVGYINNEKYGYQHQYVRNTLQVNQGVNGDSVSVFNDVALMSGIAATDWSWTPLVADFDNDGHRDLIVTNGFPKDVTDRDFIDYNAEVNAYVSQADLRAKIPSAKLNNYAFRNTGDLAFENVSANWGIAVPSFSNGAAYGDLDNDGDLDYVVNNINDAAFVYENQNLNQQNALRIKLEGTKSNPLGIGAQVFVYQDSLGVQMNDFTLSRGYLSSVEPFIHFGVGASNAVDSVVVLWQNGKKSKLEDVAVNQVLTIKNSEATPFKRRGKAPKTRLFNDLAEAVGIDFLHKEVDYIDYNIQPMLPHKLSQYGPGLAVSDVNQDGLEDLFISGSHFQKSVFYIQQKDGTFQKKNLIEYEDKGKQTAIEEELGALFFDADGDGDDDLYVVHGGYEYNIDHPQYVDKLYINNNGNFTWSENALPKILLSGLAVKAADYDKDGDLDLFVSGRVDPGEYPRAVSSYIFRNESTEEAIKFEDVTEAVAPVLTKIGMVSDALWTDYNNDGMIDLVLAGEYMAIRFLKNDDGKLVDESEKSGINQHTGWWNSLTSGDFDNDGDIDYIAGNTGRNTVTDISKTHPIRAYYNDFDKNERFDLIPSCYFPDQNGVMQEYPYFGRLEISKQYNVIQRSFPLHKDLAVTTMDKIFTPEEMKDCLVMEANNFNTSYIENLGNGKFALYPMPALVQRSPIYGMHTTDINQDGNLDVLMVGNDYGMEVSVGRMDAHDGLVAFGDGQGNFEVKSGGETGFAVRKDAKALVRLYNKAQEQQLYIASQNQGALKIYATNAKTFVTKLNKDDVYAIITMKNGKTRREEFYFGSSFLSQSNRQFVGDKNVESVVIYNTKGEKRDVSFGGLEFE